MSAAREGLLAVQAESRLLSPAYTLADLRPAILGVVYKALEEFVYKQNATQPLSKLPPELLAEVFSYLNDANRASVSLVSRTWNDILFTSPDIWRTVDVEQKKPGMVQKILSFSGSCIISLDVLIDGNNWREITSCLTESLYRCVSLSLSIGSGFPRDDKEAGKAVADAMSYPAPRLQRFRLFDHLGAFCRGYDDGDFHLFSDTAPQLNLVKLHTNIDAFRHSAGAFQHVKKVLFSPSDDLTPAHIRQMCELFVSAVEFSVEVDDASQEIRDADEGSISLPASVTQLAAVANNDISGAEALLRLFPNTNSIPWVCISLNQKAVTSQIDQAFERIGSGLHPYQAIRLETSSSKGEYNLHLYPDAINLDDMANLADGAAVRQRCIVDVHHSVSFAPLGIFEHVTKLYIGEFAVNVGDPIPPIPNVLHLTVFAVKPLFQQTDGHKGVFVLPSADSSEFGSQRQRPFLCPKLKTLCLATRTGTIWSADVQSVATRLAPEMICEFVDAYLEFEASKLESITIRGIDILQHDAESVARMLDLAVSFEIESRNLDWTCEFNRLLTWH
ncbi:hypothetical protein BKA62DRAFT_769465 [Auriculariales sp. MPI-PUGE-AT-0066]|nr:hypothetical protein BKA62DRAFT_769465 [Auriculariales sp. MPI-PUGE-AT-0066]